MKGTENWNSGHSAWLGVFSLSTVLEEAHYGPAKMASISANGCTGSVSHSLAGGPAPPWDLLPHGLLPEWSSGEKDQWQNWWIQQGICNKSSLCLLFKAFKCLLDHRLNHRHYKVEPFNTKIHFQSKIPLWEKAFHGTGLDNNSLTCNRMYEMFDDKQSFSAL